MIRLILIALVGFAGFQFYMRYVGTAETRKMKEICRAYHTPQWPKTIAKYKLDPSRAYCEIAQTLEVTVDKGSLWMRGKVDNGLTRPWTGSVVLGGVVTKTIPLGTLQPGEVKSFDENLGPSAGVQTGFQAGMMTFGGSQYTLTLVEDGQS